MSTNLFWNVFALPKGRDLSKTLKYHLAPLLWHHDGTLGGESIVLTRESHVWDDETNQDVVVTSFLMGLVRANVEDAQVLLDAILKHDAIEVYIR